MLLLNFSHPLSPEQQSQLEALLGEPISEVRTIRTQIDHEQPLAEQVVALADAAGLSSEAWQSVRILWLPPSLNVAAAAAGRTARARGLLSADGTTQAVERCPHTAVCGGRDRRIADHA